MALSIGTPTVLGPTNGFVWDTNASGNLVVDFGRNEKRFPVNRYTQIVPVPKPAGKFTKFTREEAGRIQNVTLNQNRWPDGNVAPEGTDDEKFAFANFECERYIYPYKSGNVAIDSASWDVKTQKRNIAAEKAMRARTQLVYNQLITSNNWDASHILDVTSSSAIPGNVGTWMESTTASKNIYNSITYGVELIQQDTLNGLENPEQDLHLVLSSQAAQLLGKVQEIVDMVKGSPEAFAQVKGELPGGYVRYGLPAKLYGYTLEIEDTYILTSPPGSNASVRSPIWSPTYAFLLARPGALVAPEASPPFSTVCWFAYEEMQTWTKDDVDNKRFLGRVEDYGVAEMVAAVAGIWFQNII